MTVMLPFCMTGWHCIPKELMVTQIEKHWFTVFVGGSQFVPVVLNGSQWLSVVLSGYHRFVMVISGSQWFSLVSTQFSMLLSCSETDNHREPLRTDENH